MSTENRPQFTLIHGTGEKKPQELQQTIIVSRFTEIRRAARQLISRGVDKVGVNIEQRLGLDLPETVFDLYRRPDDERPHY